MTYNLTPRRPLRGKKRQEFLVANDCTCYWCLQPITDNLWDDEHVIARELGGSDDMDNRRPIHRTPCHKQKTAQDRKLIAHSNRVQKKRGRTALQLERTPKAEPKMRSRGQLRGGGFKQGHRPLKSRNDFQRRER